MPGSIFRAGGTIGAYGVSRGPSSTYQSGSIVRVNTTSEIEYYHRKNFWSTTDGNITLLDNFTYYWDAATHYSYPPTGGSIWYDIGIGGSYLYKNNGTFAGNAVYNSDGGGSIFLDGTGDWITTFPYSLGNAVNYRTVGMFFKPTATGSQGLIGNRNSSATNTQGWSLMINRTVNGQLNVVHCNATSSPTIDYAAGITTNTWYHVTYTYDKPNLDAYLYLNGTQVASNLNFAADASNPNFNGVIGNRSSDLGGPFTGYIGLVYIINSDSAVLSGANVTALHNLLKPRFGL